MLTGAITSFTGEYEWLSNFYTAEFPWRGQMWQSGEHAFNGAKALYTTEGKSDYWETQIRVANTPSLAKKLGRKVPLDVKFWDHHKSQVMREVVHAKFSHVDRLAGKLINTGVTMLVEGNTWGDTCWGRVKENGIWKGENRLGVILMEERGYWLHGKVDQ